MPYITKQNDPRSPRIVTKTPLLPIRPFGLRECRTTGSLSKVLAVTSPPATAKILMLHGHAESGPCFQAKTRRLETYLKDAFPPSPSPNAHPDYPGGVELFYPTGPLHLTPADVTRGCGPVNPNSRSGETSLSTKDGGDLDAWAWGVGDFRQPEEIEGLAQSVTYMLEYMQEHGPFVGAIGFSCGATLAAILSSLLEGGKSVEGFTFPERFSHPPLRFAVCYSGFMLTYPSYKSVYQPKIQTPIIHVIGRYDPMTEEAQTLALAKKCKNATVMYHPGSHYVPTKAQFLRKVTEFVEAGLGRGESDDEDEEWVDI